MEHEIELEQENVIITAGGAVNSVNGQTGDVVLTTSDLENTSDYQTGDEVDAAIGTAIAGKQDTLTAGTGITIDAQNEISADTTVLATQQNLSDEATARENADINLQGQIDAISASSDVTDIVGTYAALEAYDTTHLKDNDIIKVLQDETHDGETTYYRWSTATETFTLIGEEGPYYTKSATDTLLAAKQDKLTAGSNITIDSNNEISATDTTYSNFVGTDGTAAGTAGLVPAPAATDAGKYLKADGTWATVANDDDIVELTSADYNANKNNWSDTDPANFNCVALWKLDEGVYHLPSSNFVAYMNTTSAWSNDYGVFVIVTRTTSGVARNVFYFFGNLSGIGMAVTARSSGQSAQAYTRTLGLNDVVDNLTSTSYYSPLSANQGKVLKTLIDSIAIRAAGAPTTSTAGQVGTLYEDTTNGDLYICTDATNPYVWEEVGGGPTVVQTAGSSQTDVMSQYATTNMIYADTTAKTKIRIGEGALANDQPRVIAIGPDPSNKATATMQGAIAIGAYSNATGSYSIALEGAASANGAIAIGWGSNASSAGQIDVSTTNSAYGYGSSNYRLLSGLYDGQSAHDAATVGQAIGTTETYTIATSDWSALSASSPYDYQATVTATYTIGANTIAELLNDSPVDFATHGFAIGSISSQSVTIYSIGAPSASVSLKVNYKG